MIWIVVLLFTAALHGQSLDSHLAAARKAELSGDLASAERAYEKALTLRADASTFQRLGLVRHLQNKFAQAIPAFEKSLELQPDQWACRLFLGIDFYRTNQFERARVELKQAEKLRPAEPEIRLWLGMTYLARKEYLPGLAMIEQLSGEQPENLEILRLLAENYAAFGTSLLNNVAERFPDSPAGIQVHAQALEFEGANEAALEVYRQLEKIESNRPGVKDAIHRLQSTSSAPRPPSPAAGGDAAPTPP